jgi:hypothetical protein
MLLEHVRRYVLRPEVVLLGVAAVIACTGRPDPTVSRLARGLLLGGLPYLVFMGARPLYGVDHLTMGASFWRYALPVVAVIVSLGLSGLGGEQPTRRRARLAALWTSALLGVLVLAHAEAGPLDQRAQVQRSMQFRAQVLEVVPPDAVVVTARGDKLLWPQRSTIVAAYLVRNRGEGVRSGSAMYDVLPTPHRLAHVVAGLVAAGEQVYVLSDGFPPYLGGFDLELRLAGVRREATAVHALFRITAVAPPHS